MTLGAPGVTALALNPPVESRVGQCSAQGSLMLVRVFADRIEVAEQLSDDRTEQLLAELRRLGVQGKVIFHTPCG